MDEPTDEQMKAYFDRTFPSLIYVRFLQATPLNPVMRSLGPYLAAVIFTDFNRIRVHVRATSWPSESGFTLALWEPGGWRINDGFEDENAPLFQVISFDTRQPIEAESPPAAPKNESTEGRDDE